MKSRFILAGTILFGIALRAPAQADTYASVNYAFVEVQYEERYQDAGHSYVLYTNEVNVTALLAVPPFTR